MDGKDDTPHRRSVADVEAAKTWNRVRKRDALRRILRDTLFGAAFVAAAVWLFAVQEAAFALCSVGVAVVCVLRILDNLGQLREIQECSWASLAPTIVAAGPHSSAEAPATKASEL